MLRHYKPGRVGAIALAAVLALAGPGIAAELVIDFESSTYTTGNLAGQDGWTQILGTDPTGAQVIGTDNGPTLAGTQSVDVTNALDEIRLEKPITDMVAAGGPIVTLQYDLKNVRNALDLSNPDPLWSLSLFRVRLDDDTEGYPAVSNFNYDGGAGPASQAFASSTADGLTGNWAPGGPAWLDQNWHTVAWMFNYDTRQFLNVSFDGVDYPQTGWYFNDSNGPTPGGFAAAADLLRMWLQSYDNNDNYRLDNIVVTALPVPLPAGAWLGLVLLGGIGGVGMIRRKLRRC